MLDSLIKMGSAALLGPAGPIVSSLVGGVLSKGGSDPLQSLLGAISDPFKTLFSQAGNLLPTSVLSTPAAFQTPALSSSVDDLLKGFGDFESKEAEAMKLLQSDKFSDQVAGQQKLQKLFQAQQLINTVLANRDKVRGEIIQNTRIS